jgi:hypothetical protein
MSINTNYPNVRPSLLLDFSSSQQLDPRVTFSRSTTAPYYDGKTSVLAEQNLLLQSQAIATSPWLLNNATSANNTILAPDGTTTGGTLTASATTNIHITSSPFTPLVNTPYTISSYLQKGTNNYGYLTISNFASSGAWVTAVFDLNLGTVSQTSAGVSGNYISSSITQIGSTSWYRCTITGSLSVVSASSNAIFIGLAPASTGNTFGSTGGISYSATGTESFYIWGGQIEQRSSVTAYNATTTTAITNYIPQLLTAPINAPRFDFNPVTGESLGLLIEQSSTNLLLYSQDFNNAYWVKANSTINNTANIAPDGTQTFNKLIESTSTSEHYINSSTYTAIAGAYTLSIYAKASERSSFFMDFKQTDATQGRIVFNLATQTATVIYGTSTSYSIISEGNNVYKCTFTATLASNTNNIKLGIYQGGGTSYTGDGFSGIYIWGGQLEALPFPTSYIATTSAQVTRASDNASMTGTNFSSWYNIAQGTLYSESTTNRPSADVSAISIKLSDGTNNNRIQLGRTNATSLAIRTYVTTNGTDIVSAQGNGTTTQGQFAKTSFSFINNNYTGSALGLITNTTSTGNVPNLNKLDIGFDSVNSGAWVNGWIKKIAYYPQTVTSANQQALTGT